MGVDYSSLNYESNDTKIEGKYKGRPRNTIPDGVFDLIRDNMYTIKVFGYEIPTFIPKDTEIFKMVQYAEVKAMDNTLYTSSNSGQISAMLFSMSRNEGVRKYGGQFIIGTTSDAVLSPNIITEGAGHGIQVIQMTARYRMVSGVMQVRF